MTLGRTGLSVSVAGLGGGGASCLGMRTGGTAENAVTLIRRALDLGINHFDTAETYRTEVFFGEALTGVPRDSVVISSKKTTWKEEGPTTYFTAEELVQALDASLQHLRTDHVDIYHLHGLGASSYDHAVAEWVPALKKLRQQGKIRAVAVSEPFESDQGHVMLSRAVHDGWPDVVMVGFNILNPSARERILVPAKAKGIGTQVMFAVRRAFSRPERLREILEDLRARGRLGPGLDDGPEPLGFLLKDGGAESLTDAAYRFCRHEPGVHTVLFGTGDIAHLQDNVMSLSRPPLPDAVLARLRSAFGNVDDVSGG